MKPYRNCDLLVKVDAKGAMLATYRLYLNKSTTLWTSLEVGKKGGKRNVDQNGLGFR